MVKSEKEKMLSGELYNALDEQLVKERIRTRLLLRELNMTREDEPEKLFGILKDLIPDSGRELVIQIPFYCDYGTNISLGDQVYFNFNCVILDVMPVKIGSRCLFGPNVQIYAAMHPMDHRQRASGLENGKPVIIGDDVWIGGGVIINPGVTIGSKTVIGSGSVVTRDIPSDVLAAGNPCRVIRTINSEV